MCVTGIKIATTIVLTALACAGLCQTGRSSADAGSEDVRKLGEVTATMFPDGVEHDFGKVRRGPMLEHTFRIVNTSNRPLEIISVRCG
jgi:hypothetical protein